MRTNYTMPYFSIATPHHVKMGCLPLKNYGRPIQDTLPAHRHSFAPEWQHNTQAAEQQAAYTLQQSEAFYNTHIRSLPDIQIGSSVAL